MNLKEKPEKDRLREQLDGAVLDANIKHKQQQIADLQARIAQIEQEEADAKEAEWQGMVAELEERTRQT